MSSILRVDQLQTQSGTPVATFSSTGRVTFAGGVTLPEFAEANRPTGVPNGTLIINQDTLAIEVYLDGEWKQIGGSGANKLVEFKVWGAGGGSGSQQRSNTNYHTNTFYNIKEGGAGGFVTASFNIASGTQLILSPGQPGRGGLLDGNPSDARASFNGGGYGSYTTHDASGSGGGYSGVFLAPNKNQANAILIAPGGGAGSGGPGYPGNAYDNANGGGGISNVNGTGNKGANNFSNSDGGGRGGTPTAGGAAGPGGGQYGAASGAPGSSLQGGNAVHHRNAWGSSSGGGGGWYGGGSGSSDGNAWSGGGGGSGSAFVRGSGIPTSPANDPLLGVEYVSHTFGIQNFGQWGDGSAPGGRQSMRGPAGTSDAQYPSNDVGYGGQFRIITSGGPSGYDGGSGAIVYRIDGGSWQTVTYTGADVTITL